MTNSEIRTRFLKFFEERGHRIVPSSSLLPDDPSVLFTTAGMQQFKPYYTGAADAMKDFGLLNTTSIQKSMRTSDIDEVGDESHLTFFEMLGNFSFGGYWKEAAIAWAHEFVTREMSLKIDYVTVFGGEGNVPADEESEKLWKTIDKDIEVRRMGRTDNFWGPTGNEGPCGPTTEIYCKNTDGKSVEIWNVVFNQYYQDKESKLENLKTAGIDTGMGLERLAMIVQKKKNIFETDLFERIFSILPESLDEKTKRIIADHARSSVFLLADGVRPSNKEQGYVLRRLLRRLIVHENVHEATALKIDHVLSAVINSYGTIYNNLNNPEILQEFIKERNKFNQTLTKGLKELNRTEKLDATSAFKLYESFGLPYEIIKDLGKEKSSELTREAFDGEFKKHQEKSRAGAEKKFGGHGLLMDTGELKAGNEEELKKATRLHTATHLLHAALRKILGSEVHQAGSDITAERLRFDFNFSRKLTPEELKQIEDIANDAVHSDFKVSKEEMSYEDAIKSGALAFFKLKYPPKVNVYSVGNFSKELCGGPHVSHSAQIGRIKITKEEAVSAGVRRIRAIVE